MTATVKAPACWISGDKAAVETFVNTNKQHIAQDNVGDGDIVYRTRLQRDIDRAARDFPLIRLATSKALTPQGTQPLRAKPRNTYRKPNYCHMVSRRFPSKF